MRDGKAENDEIIYNARRIWLAVIGRGPDISAMNPEESYADITKIETTNDDRHANAYLKAGWRLLKIVTPSDGEGGTFHKFVMGWPNHESPAYVRQPL